MSRLTAVTDAGGGRARGGASPPVPGLRGRLLLAAAAGLSMLAVALPVRAGPDDTFDYRATAAGDAVRVQATIEDFLFVPQILDVGGATTQAHVDSLGTSTAFASYPYPGSLAAANPNYPFVVKSSSPSNPESRMDHGAYALEATSEPDASSATARGGINSDAGTAGRTQSDSDVAVDRAAETVTAEATAVSEAVSFAGTLRLGRVLSHARVVAAPGQEPERESTLRIEGASVGGQPVAVTSDGLVLADSETPLEEDAGVAELLADSGITVRYLEAVQTPDGVLAPGIEVRVRREIPGVGPGTAAYTLGRARAFAEAQGATGDGSPDVTGDFDTSDFDPSTADTTGDSGDTGPAGPADRSRPADTGTPAAEPDRAAAPLETAPAPTARSGGGDEAPPAETAPPREQPADAEPTSTLATSSNPDGFTTTSFYATLGVVALATLGGAQLVRSLGVRQPWSS